MKTTTAWALLLLPLAGGGSYQRLSTTEEARLYRTRGQAYVGRCLHLHLPPRPFLAPPGEVRPRPDRCFHAYRHRGLTILVHPRNPYYRQFRRKRKAGKIICVKGRMARCGGKLGAALVVHRLRALTPGRRRRL